MACESACNCVYMCMCACVCVLFARAAVCFLGSDRASESGLCKQVASIPSCNAEAVPPVDCAAGRPSATTHTH